MERISVRWVGRCVLLVALVVLGVGLLSAPALARRHHRVHRTTNSISITGPTSVKLGTPFRFHLRGFLAKPATKVAVFEDSRACAVRQLDELHRMSSAEMDQFFPPAGHHFSRIESLFARNPGKHYLCAYVFNRSVPSHRTYARATHIWRNHA
ncbi:MAG: hypothetical protein U0T02_01230 [Solirubrobacteraceae bacterium]